MTAPFMIAVPGSSRFAAPFAVADAPVTRIVTVLVRSVVIVPRVVVVVASYCGRKMLN